MFLLHNLVFHAATTGPHGRHRVVLRSTFIRLFAFGCVGYYGLGESCLQLREPQRQTQISVGTSRLSTRPPETTPIYTTYNVQISFARSTHIGLSSSTTNPHEGRTARRAGVCVCFLLCTKHPRCEQAPLFASPQTRLCCVFPLTLTD